MSTHERALRDMALQHAIEWISARLQEEPGANRSMVIDEASREFDLTPLQQEFLYHQFHKVAR